MRQSRPPHCSAAGRCRHWCSSCRRRSHRPQPGNWRPYDRTAGEGSRGCTSTIDAIAAGSCGAGTNSRQRSILAACLHMWHDATREASHDSTRVAPCACRAVALVGICVEQLFAGAAVDAVHAAAALPRRQLAGYAAESRASRRVLGSRIQRLGTLLLDRRLRKGPNRCGKLIRGPKQSCTTQTTRCSGCADILNPNAATHEWTWRQKQHGPPLLRVAPNLTCAAPHCSCRCCWSRCRAGSWRIGCLTRRTVPRRVQKRPTPAPPPQRNLATASCLPAFVCRPALLSAKHSGADFTVHAGLLCPVPRHADACAGCWAIRLSGCRCPQLTYIGFRLPPDNVSRGVSCCLRPNEVRWTTAPEGWLPPQSLLEAHRREARLQSVRV